MAAFSVAYRLPESAFPEFPHTCQGRSFTRLSPPPPRTKQANLQHELRAGPCAVDLQYHTVDVVTAGFIVWVTRDTYAGANGVVLFFF